MPRNVFLLVCALLSAATPAFAATWSTKGYPRFQSSVAAQEYGRVAGVFSNGDAFFAGTGTSPTTSVIGARVDIKRGITKWRTASAGYPFQVSCGAVAGDVAYVGGQEPTGGRLVQFSGEGAIVHSYFDATTDTSGFTGVAVDPVDGTVWAVATVASAPGKARLYHFSASLVPLGSPEEYQDGTAPTSARSIAVTADRIYIGGRAYDISVATDRPWIMARARTTPGQIFSTKITPHNGKWIMGISAVAGELYSTMALENAGVQNLELIKHDPATGASLRIVAIFAAAPMPGANIFMGNVVRHPSLPIVLVSTDNGFKGFTQDLNAIPGLEAQFVGGLAGSVASRIAVDDRLDFTVYGAFSRWDSMFANYIFEGAGVSLTSEFTSTEGGSRLLAAPNRLDLAKPGAKIRFVLRLPELMLEGGVRIHDMSGKPVALLEKKMGTGGSVDFVWDGRTKDGVRLAPGTYLAVAEGTGFAPRTDRALFVITGAAQ